MLASLTLESGDRRLKLHCKPLKLLASRDLFAPPFARWAASYRALRATPDPGAALFALGREMYDWLDADGWLQDLSVRRPLALEFRTAGDRLSETQRRFLACPWEILATKDGYLAANRRLRYQPARRLGAPAAPLLPSDHRLYTLFMAAAPRGERHLNFEDEENAILDATATLGLDLVVEESGALPWLAARIRAIGPEDARRGDFDIIHLSCHGVAEPEPMLSLEDDGGDPAPTAIDDLVESLANKSPRLLFLSACLTAAAYNAAARSMALEMVDCGLPAVLGWAGSVRDAEATHFAHHLYGALVAGQPLAAAAASARRALLAPPAGKEPARDWHLARLYLSPEGGGRLVAGGPAPTRLQRETGNFFLDMRDHRVPVAAPHEFVGRRRPLQRTIRAIRARGPKRPAGVLIHGLGSQGKSSLAARLHHRLPDHRLALVYGARRDGTGDVSAYNADGVLASIERAVQDEALRQQIRAARHRLADGEAVDLEALLRGLLTGPFRQRYNAAGTRPLLLVIDDFETALTPSQGERHRVDPVARGAIRAVIQAFRRAETDSALVFTSRYRFTLPGDDGRDLSRHLTEIHLESLTEGEGRKQDRALANAKRRSATPPADLERSLAAGAGHPLLQRKLFELAASDRPVWDRATADLERYLASGVQPDETAVREELERLYLDGLLALLTEHDRELLQCSAAFRAPIPLAALEAIATAFGLKRDGKAAGEALFDLGLWERTESPVRAGAREVVLSPLVRPLATAPADEDIAAIVGTAMPAIWAGWTGRTWSLEAAEEAIRLMEIARWEAASELTQRRALMELRLMLGNHHSEWGRREEALEETRRAERIARGLVALDREEGIADLASSLNNLGNMLSGLGRREEALRAAQEATDIYRKLAETRPDAFLPNLAMSLNNLGAMLSGLGRREEALQATQEAVDIRRKLAETRPDAFLPNLAMSLNNLGNRLSDLGRREEALRATQASTAIYQRLTNWRPDAFQHYLAVNHLNLSVHLHGLGRQPEAFRSVAEAIRLLSPLFLRHPPAFAQWMLTMLQNYFALANDVGQPPDPQLVGPVIAVLEPMLRAQED